MKRWKVFGYIPDFNCNNKKQFVGITKAKSEHDALIAVRKRFKFLRNRMIEVEEQNNV